MSPGGHLHACYICINLRAGMHADMCTSACNAHKRRLKVCRMSSVNGATSIRMSRQMSAHASMRMSTQMPTHTYT